MSRPPSASSAAGPHAGTGSVTLNQAGDRLGPAQAAFLSGCPGLTECRVLPVRRSSMPCASIQADALITLDRQLAGAVKDLVTVAPIEALF
jgi:hypothetical protein